MLHNNFDFLKLAYYCNAQTKAMKRLEKRHQFMNRIGKEKLFFDIPWKCFGINVIRI